MRKTYNLLMLPVKLLKYIISRVIITLLLLPIAVLALVFTYSGRFFTLILYAWIRPKKTREIWEQFKEGWKNLREGKEKLVIDKRFYIVMIFVLLLLCLKFFLK
jgi:hypothetical protein